VLEKFTLTAASVTANPASSLSKSEKLQTNAEEYLGTDRSICACRYARKDGKVRAKI